MGVCAFPVKWMLILQTVFWAAAHQFPDCDFSIVIYLDFQFSVKKNIWGGVVTLLGDKQFQNDPCLKSLGIMMNQSPREVHILVRLAVTL